MKLIVCIYDGTTTEPIPALPDEPREAFLQRWKETEQAILDTKPWGRGDKFLNGHVVAFCTCNKISTPAAVEVGDSIADTLNLAGDGFVLKADDYNIRGTLKDFNNLKINFLFRIAKSKTDAERIAQRVNEGTMTEAQFRKATRSLLPAVAEIYNWKIRRFN